VDGEADIGSCVGRLERAAAVVYFRRQLSFKKCIGGLPICDGANLILNFLNSNYLREFSLPGDAQGLFLRRFERRAGLLLLFCVDAQGGSSEVVDVDLGL
jgi:hypothetical protein